MRYLLPDGWVYRKNRHLGGFLQRMPIVQITQCTGHPILFADSDDKLDAADDDAQLDDASDDELDDAISS